MHPHRDSKSQIKFIEPPRPTVIMNEQFKKAEILHDLKEF